MHKAIECCHTKKVSKALIRSRHVSTKKSTHFELLHGQLQLRHLVSDRTQRPDCEKK